MVNSKGGATSGPNLMSMEELRDLFSYDPTTLSSTYESLCKDDRTDQERAAGQQQQQQAPEMDGQVRVPKGPMLSSWVGWRSLAGSCWQQRQQFCSRSKAAGLPLHAGCTSH